MKTISTGLTNLLAGSVLSLCTLWRVQRQDGTVMGFTDHLSDLTYDDGRGSLVYAAQSGYTRAALQANAAFNVDNTEIEGFLDSAEITDTDVRAGLYDQAEVTVMWVNYEDLTMGHITLRAGRLCNVTLKDDYYMTELRGWANNLQQQFVESVSHECRADLGDARCKVVMTGFTFTGTITGTDGYTFDLTGVADAHPDNYFYGGLLKITSGPNTGISLEIKGHTGANVQVFIPFPHAFVGGETFEIKAGCDKNYRTCIAKFNNILNFRGEPYLPGWDTVIRYPDGN